MPLPVEAGPARLHYLGQDYLLTDPTFTLGRQPGCDIVFDSDTFRGVAARHCEIVYDHRTYMLLDHSRDGTLVNDCPVAGSVVLRPGDWIRLGPDGPVLRFLGRTSLNGSALMTTA
jgi:pSer/pThr/pTyr-binding forkhead associated (FHA) protein